MVYLPNNYTVNAYCSKHFRYANDQATMILDFVYLPFQQRGQGTESHVTEAHITETHITEQKREK